MNQLLKARRNIRRKVNANEKLDQYLHFLIILILISNMVLILYAMFSVSLRMTIGGVGLIDTLPIALYILPLMVFLPLMIRAYYRERAAVWNFVFLIISSVFFGLLSSLIRGFIICLILNILAVVSIFIMGRFRPKGSLRKVGKKGLVYVILLNMLGLTFPVSVALMGQNPIATTIPSSMPQIILTVPLSDFDFPYENVQPTPDLLTDILDHAFYLDFKIHEDNISSWTKLRSWLVAINETAIEYTITLVPNRVAFVESNPDTLATTELIENIYQSHSNAFTHLVDVSMINITNHPDTVLFDMTLSRQEWQALMLQTRSLNLVGFGSLMRTSIYATQLDNVSSASLSLQSLALAQGIEVGLIVETFVVDDLQDRDTGAMRFCGTTINSLTQWDEIIVSCERSRFSFEMAGDVGEYLSHSFSSSLGVLAGTQWGMRLGEIGNSTDVLGRQDSVYESLEVLANDIALVAGNGVNRITVSSLPSLLSTFGNNGLAQLRTAIDEVEFGIATYTFRIYAYRAVFMAIDAFDFLMF